MCQFRRLLKEIQGSEKWDKPFYKTWGFFLLKWPEKSREHFSRLEDFVSLQIPYFYPLQKKVKWIFLKYGTVNLDIDK